MADGLKISLQFSGGAELLFDKVRKHDATLPKEPGPWNIKKLLIWIRDNLLKERPELFMQGDSVDYKRKGGKGTSASREQNEVHLTDEYRRPGILVLVNDTDWELLGELDYELQENDNIVFISTLHGG